LPIAVRVLVCFASSRCTSSVRACPVNHSPCSSWVTARWKVRPNSRQGGGATEAFVDSVEVAEGGVETGAKAGAVGVQERVNRPGSSFPQKA
jgi:hypothetical protein